MRGVQEVWCAPYFSYGKRQTLQRNEVVRYFWRNHIIFTSMFTPDGNERFVRASTTFGPGFKISITRLCVRISNCSRASLWTNVDRLTVYFLICVGNGIGPTTFASKRVAVSIICLTEASRILCSYACTRIRNLLMVPAFSAADCVAIIISIYQ